MSKPSTASNTVVESFLKAGGRLAHIDRSNDGAPGKVLTVAYLRSDEHLLFSGCMFTPDEDAPVFSRDLRRRNNDTAIRRCLQWGHRVDDPVGAIMTSAHDGSGEMRRDRCLEDDGVRAFIDNAFAVDRMRIRRSRSSEFAWTDEELLPFFKAESYVTDTLLNEVGL